MAHIDVAHDPRRGSPDASNVLSTPVAIVVQAGLAASATPRGRAAHWKLTNVASL